jgi:hypothetical protein
VRFTIVAEGDRARPRRLNAGSVAGIRAVGSSITYAACCWSSAAFS